LAKSCIDAQLSLAVVISDSGAAANIVSKFRPNVPLIVVTSQPNVAAQACLTFGQKGYLVPERDFNMGGSASGALGHKGGLLIQGAIEWAIQQGILVKVEGVVSRVACMTGYSSADTATDSNAVVSLIEI
jgi:pyruvate kinase